MEIKGLLDQSGLAAAGAEEADSVRNAIKSADKSSGETGASGDTLEISEEGRALSMKMGGLAEKGSDSGDGEDGAANVKPEEDDSEDEPLSVQRLREQIKQLQEELKAVQQDETLPEKQKQAKIMEINQQLMELTQELAKQTGAKFNGAIQGTRAEGFASSLT